MAKSISLTVTAFVQLAKYLDSPVLEEKSGQVAISE